MARAETIHGRMTVVLLAASLLASMTIAPATVLAACSIQSNASSRGGDVTVEASAACGGGVQAIRVLADGVTIATVPGGNANVTWAATGAPGPRTIVVEAAEVGDTSWSQPVRASMTLEVAPAAEAPSADLTVEPFGDNAEFEVTPLFSVVPSGGAEGAEDGPCVAQEDAYDEVQMRAFASLSTLEALRAYEAALDEKYNATREHEYANAVVDVASLAAGWPLGKGVQDALLGKVKEDLKEKLIKASFKSVNKALLKDPSISGALDQLDNYPTELSGAAYDQFKEASKYGLNQLMKGAGDTVFGFLDVAVLGKKIYAGMNSLDAIRAMLRNVQDRILAGDAQHQAEMAMLDHAANAVALCQDGVPPADNWRWQETRGYLGLPEAEGTGAAPQPSGPTAAEGYYVMILEGIGLVLATEREVAQTPACSWNGGGPRPCPGAPPAAISGRLGGPYNNSTEAFADLKTRLECSRGYWGDFTEVGGKRQWLQNNITVAACKTVKQL